MNNKALSKIFLGLCIILAGIGLLLSNLGYWSFSSLVISFWPIILLIFAINNLLEGKFLDSVFWFVLSVLFQMRSLGAVNFNGWTVFFSMLIILIGAKIIFPDRNKY